jgi:rubrerythrin
MENPGERGRTNVMDKVPEFYMLYGFESESSAISSVERLMNEFEAHEGEEEKILRHYRQVAGETKNPLVKMLLQLIISDEEKHRALTHSMLSTLKGDLTWTKPDDAIRGLYDIGEAKEKLLAVTEAFIRLEKEGLKGSKGLIKGSKGYHHGVFALFLRCMITDTEKHIDILEFLRQRLKEA